MNKKTARRLIVSYPASMKHETPLCKYVVSTIRHRQEAEFYSRPDNDPRTISVPISARNLKNTFGNDYKREMDRAESLYIDKRREYSTGNEQTEAHCREYTIRPDLYQEEWTTEQINSEWAKQIANDIQENNRVEMRRLRGTEYANLAKDLKSASVDFPREQIEQFNLTGKKKVVEGYGGQLFDKTVSATDRTFTARYQLTNFLDGIVSIKKSEFGRFYSTYSMMMRELKPYLRIDDLPVAEIDLKSSQPVFLACYLRMVAEGKFSVGRISGNKLISSLLIRIPSIKRESQSSILSMFPYRIRKPLLPAIYS